MKYLKMFEGDGLPLFFLVLTEISCGYDIKHKERQLELLWLNGEMVTQSLLDLSPI